VRRAHAQGDGRDQRRTRVATSHIVAEIGAVLAGDSVGRSSDEEITLYKSLGVASQDLSAAWHVFEQAQRRNLGVAAAL
jgi:ornithine cyclodeaminase